MVQEYASRIGRSRLNPLVIISVFIIAFIGTMFLSVAAFGQTSPLSTAHLNFDGVDDRVDLGALNVPGQGLTIEAWFNSADLRNCNFTYRDCRLVSKATGQNSNDHYWMLSTVGAPGTSDTKLRFRLKTNNSTTTLVANTGLIQNDQWYHAAATYDGSTMRLFLDGVLVGSTTKSGDLNTNDSVPVYIGNNPVVNKPWEGQIDDVRIWNVARGQNELEAFRSVELDGTEEGLVAYYRFNESSGQIALDSSGNGNNGQLGTTINTDSADPDWANGSVDTEAPSTPGGIVGNAVSANQIDLAWSASDDNVGVALYRIFRDGVEVDTTTTLTYTDTGLSELVTYAYAVVAEDATGNQSDPSDTFTVTTPQAPDTQAPTTPQNLGTVNIAQSQIDLVWDASTDNVAVTEYVLYQNGVELASISPPETSYADTTVLPSRTYEYYVVARDAAGNESAPTATLEVVTPIVEDTEAPSVPEGLNAAVIGDTQVDLSWGVSSDNIAVARYIVERDGVEIAQSTAASYSDTSVLPGSLYSYIVYAEDAAGNRSGGSFSAQADVVDISAPAVTIAQPLDATVLSDQVNIGVDATDNVGISQVDVYLDGALFGSSNTEPFGFSWDTTAFDDGSYELYAEAVDEAGNVAQSNVINVSVLNNPSLGALPGSQHLVFDGNDDRLTLGNLDASPAGLTLEAWVNSANLANCSARDCRIISKATGVNEQDHYWMVSTIASGSNTALRFRLKVGGSTSTLISNSNVPQNQWVHIAASFDGAAMRLYQDGILVGSLNRGGSITQNATVPAWVGDNPTSGSRAWDGAIDDVRIWSIARSEADVRGSMNSELSGLESGLLAYYKLNEGAGQSLNDASGNQGAATLGASANSEGSDPSWALSAPDTEAPTAPTGLVVSNLTASSIDLVWAASTDNVAVVNYQVLHNGSVIATTAGSTPSFELSGLAVDTTYNLSVQALDAAGNISAASNSISVTTLTPDTIPPSGEITSPSDGASVAGTVPVVAAADDNVAVDLVELLVDGSIMDSLDSAPFEFAWNTAAVSNGSHDLVLRVTDTSGNEFVTPPISVVVDNQTPTVGALPGSQHLVFDGLNDHVELGTYDVPTTGITLEAWVNSTDLANCASRDCRIISKATGVNEQDHYWMLSTIASGNNTALRFRLKLNGNTQTLISSSNVPQNAWVHIAATYDGSTMRLFQDGVQVGAQAASGTISGSSTTSAWIGDSPGGGRPWQGAIDDVRIWGISRTQTEIDNGKDLELTGLESGLVAYYQLNEGGGQVAIDLSVNGLNGILGSSTAVDSADPVYGIELPDTEAPTAPTDLNAASVYSTQVDLSWSASTDDRAVVQYVVERDGVELDSTDTSSYTDLSVSPESSYIYIVYAEDAAGNRSPASSPVAISSPSAQPITFSNVTASGIQIDHATITWNTNDTGTSQIVYGEDTDYGQSTAATSTKVASHSIMLSGLEPATTYHYQVVSTNDTGSYASGDFTFMTASDILIGGEFGFEYATINAATGSGGRTAIADIDGDGLNDVTVHVWGAGRGRTANGTLTWYRYPDWEPVVIDAADNFFGDGVVVADIDGDGDNDVITAKGNDAEASLYWYENPGDGTGTWSEYFVHTMETSSEVKDIEIHDMDHDGKLDIVARSKHRTNIYYQDAPQSWTILQTVTQQREGMTLSDVDHDGDEDIVINGWWLENPGARATASLTQYVFDSEWFGQTSGTFRDDAVMASAGDYDGDGDEDFSISHAEHAGYTAAWYESVNPKAGESGFIKHSIAQVDYAHNNASADYDLDGDIDIILGNSSWASNDRIFVYLNDGTGENWTEQVIGDTPGYKGVIGDIDNDGDMDFTSSWNWETQPVYVLRNTTDPVSYRPSLDQWQRHAFDAQMPWRAIFVEHADLNGDGLQDVVAGSVWYANPGSVDGQWVQNSIGSPLNNMATVYDFDGDGDIDILGTEGVSSSSNRNMVWAENDGTGNFTIHSNINVGGNGDFLQGVAADRFTSGGPIQVALSWHNNGGGVQMLTVPSDPTTGTWSWEIISNTNQEEQLSTGDIDLDGDKDLLLGNKWLRNDTGNWTAFTLYTPSGIDNHPDRSRLIDMNGDGRLDAVVGYEAISVPGRAAWYEQPTDPTGTWTEHIIDNAVVGPMSLDVSDMDYDGDVDIAIGEHNLANTAYARTLVYENLGDSLSWEQHVVHTGDEHHDGMQIVDLDNDGDKDMISIGWGSLQVKAYENTSSAPSGGWWDESYGFRTSLSFSPDGVERNNYPFETMLNFTDLFADAGSSGTLIEASLRVVEVNQSGTVIDAAVPFQFNPARDYNSTNNAAGELTIVASGQTLGSATRNYHVYFDHTGSFSPANFSDQVIVTDGIQNEGLESYQIQTSNATWFYQKAAGGFSSVIDASGNDWISYSTAPGSAGEFRGIPNAIFPEGEFHPGAAGSTSTLIHDGPVKAVIHTVTNDGQWEAEWHVYQKFATMRLLQADHSYWFLYEGTPGGSSDAVTDTVVRSSGEVQALNATWTGDLAEEWVYFGDGPTGRSLFVAHHEDDAVIDSYRLMNNEMTVFGFGREGVQTLMSSSPQTFSVGLFEGTGFATSAPTVRGIHAATTVNAGSVERQ